MKQRPHGLGLSPAQWREVVRLYQQEGLYAKEIAPKFGVNPESLKRYLGLYGIKSTEARLTKNRFRKQIVNMIHDGCAVIEVARELGISHSTVDEVIREEGLTEQVQRRMREAVSRSSRHKRRDLIIHLLRRGDMTHTQIGKHVGAAQSTVSRWAKKVKR